MQYSVGIDIGGTKIAAGIVDEKGTIHHKVTYPTPKESNQEVLNLLKTIVLQLSEEAQQENITLAGIGIGSAGQIDSKRGIVLSGTDNIRDWNHVDLAPYLSQFTDKTIYLDNDANTFAVAEYLLGNGKGMDHLICLTLGTGIGGGVIVDGKLLNGEWGGAGELGHITVNLHGPQCNCGSKGCIETYASGTGIANRMREKVADLKPDEDIGEYRQDPERITSQQVFEWYEAGLPAAREVIELAVEALSYGIINLIHTFNPKKIVFGGGLIEKNPWLLDKVKEQVDELGLRSLVETVEFSLSGLGYDSGLIGAAQQVWIKKD